MRVAVRYFSRGGNTKRLAEAVADAVGVKAEEIGVPLTEDVDVLFLCNSVYAAGVDAAVRKFIRNPGVKIADLVNVSTAALLPSTYKQVRKLADEQSIRVDEREFHCRGQFHSMHKGHPDAEDLRAAQEFARSVIG